VGVYSSAPRAGAAGFPAGPDPDASPETPGSPSRPPAGVTAGAVSYLRATCRISSCLMIAKTFFLAKDFHRIGALSLREKISLRDHGVHRYPEDRTCHGWGGTDREPGGRVGTAGQVGTAGRVGTAGAAGRVGPAETAGPGGSGQVRRVGVAGPVPASPVTPPAPQCPCTTALPGMIVWVVMSVMGHLGCYRQTRDISWAHRLCRRVGALGFRRAL
jgi:hypothetical protein